MGQEIPGKIREIIHRYQRDDKDYDVLPSLVEYHHERYYYVYYKPSENVVVIREDGQIPPFDEVKPVIEIASSLVSINDVFYPQGEEYLKERTISTYNWILKMLSRIDTKLRSEMPPEIAKGLDAFIEVAEIQIKCQKNIRDAVYRGRDFIQNLVKENRLTEADVSYLRQLVVVIVENGHKRNQQQVQTYQARQQLMDYLRKKVPFWNLSLWLDYKKLKFNHDRMKNHLTYEDEEAIEEIESAIKDGIQFIKDNKIIKEIFDSTLNPR